MATTIPPLFRCPISLELMRDPVTLCTGMTYDRESIEQWLAEGNKTCPATMQSIESLDLVPNHTLRRLFQSWCAANKTPVPAAPLDRDSVQRVLQRIGRLAKNCDQQEQQPMLLLELLRKLRMSAKESPRNAQLIVGARPVPVLAMVVESGSLEASEEAIAVLSVLAIGPQDADARLLEEVRRILASSSTKSSSSEAKINAATLVEKLAEDWELKIELGASQGLIEGLIDMLSEPRSAKASLRALSSLLAIRRNRARALSYGAVHRLIELLADAAESKSRAELALGVLELLCRSAEGRASFATHELAMFVVTKKMFRVSVAATEHAIAVLWSVCKFSADESVRRKAVDANAFERLLLLLHVDCSATTKQQVCDLLKLLRSVYSEDPCIIASPDQPLPAFVPIYAHY